MTSSPERRDQVGAFFVAHADRVRRAVRRRAERVGDETIDDACQIAWATLLRRPDITLDRGGLGWLTTVAVHEAWRQGSTTEETLAGTLIGPPGVHDEGELPEPADTQRRGTEDKVLDRLEHIERFHAVHTLKPAQREALYLKGLGYSYKEIMRLTGASYTAVNRRITEGHAALRRHLGEQSGPRRWLPRPSPPGGAADHDSAERQYR